MKKFFNRKSVIDTVATYLVLIIVSLMFLFPVFWIVISSFSRSGSIYDYDGFFPSKLSIQSYVTLFTDTTMYDYPQWFKNIKYYL